MITNLLLEGAPGVGKTTLISKIAEHLSGQKIRGFYTQEIREYGQRVGFRIETFSGKTGILSHRNFRNGPIVGRYRVDVPNFEKTVLQELESALAQSVLIFIDEIGKMELFSDKFKAILPHCFDSENKLLATIMSRANTFTDQLKNRTDVRRVKVTIDNRSQLVSDLLQVIMT